MGIFCYQRCFVLLASSFSRRARVFLFLGVSGGRFRNGVTIENTLMGRGDGRASNEARCSVTILVNIIELWLPETLIYLAILCKFDRNTKLRHSVLFTAASSVDTFFIGLD